MTPHRPRHALPEGADRDGLLHLDEFDDDEPPAPPAGIVAPTREDAVARAASAITGGPAGTRLASATGFWRAIPVLVLLAVTVLAVGVVERQHCRAQGWTTPDQFFHACYSDIPVLYGSANLGTGDRPTLAEATGELGLGQPPLTSAAMWAVSALVPGDAQGAPRNFFDVSVLLLAACLAVGVVALALAAGRRRWDAAHLALSPLIVTAGLISYTLLAVALLALALLAWSRGRAVPAGVLLGLAVASGGFPLALVAVALVVVALADLNDSDAGAGGGIGPALRAAVVALVVWLAVRALLLAQLTGGIRAAWEEWRSAPPGYGSIWLAPQLLEASRPDGRHWWFPFGELGPIGGRTASAVSLALTLVLVAGVAGWVLRGPGLSGAVGRRSAFGGLDVRPAARIALALLAGALVLSTSLPVQASLLVLPLVALAGLRWRDHLLWATTECVYFVGVWLYIAAQSEPDRGLPASIYLPLLLARLVGLGWLAVQALRPPAPPAVPAPA